MPYVRIVEAPTNEPKLGEAPWLSIASSQLANASGPMNASTSQRASGDSSGPACSMRSLTGALVLPSPMISVVIPWVILLTTRPSPRRKAPREWLWISMKPGATT